MASLACFYSLRVFRIRRTCLMTEQRKAPIESLRSQAESLGLSMHKSDSEGLYYLAKEEAVSGESRRIGPDMGPDDIAALLKQKPRSGLLFVQLAGLLRSLGGGGGEQKRLCKRDC